MVSVRGVLNLPPPKASADAAGPAASPVEVAGWTWEPERRGARVVRGLGRLVLFGAAAVLIAVGVRSLFLPQRAAPAAVSSVSGFPSDALAVAARFTSVYLTTAGDPDQRAAALRLDVAADAQVVTDWRGTGLGRADSVD